MFDQHRLLALLAGCSSAVLLACAAAGSSAVAQGACPPVPEPQTANNPAYYAYVNTYDARCASRKNWDREFDDVTISSGSAADGRLELTTSTAVGGAVASLKWNGKELIASGGHGTLLQWAFHAWPEGGAGSECFNPTQAGSRADDRGPPPDHGPSTSALYVHRRSGAAGVVTEQRPAMYVPRWSTTPGFGDCWPAPLQPDRPPYTYGLSPDWLEAETALAPTHGLAGLDNVVRMRAVLTREELYPHSDAILVAYLQREFQETLTVDPTSGAVRSRGASDPGTASPVIRCVAGRTTCLGLYFKPGVMPSAYYYTMTNGPTPYNAQMGEYTAQVTVPTSDADAKQAKLTYEVYVAVGDLKRVVRSIQALAAPTPAPAPVPPRTPRAALGLSLRGATLSGVRRRRTLVLHGTTRPAQTGSMTLRLGTRARTRPVTVPLVAGRFKLHRRLAGPEARARAVRIALDWAGDTATLPAHQRFWTGRRSARLRVTRLATDPATRRIELRGRVRRRARGAVALIVEPPEGAGDPQRLRARIRRGRFAWRGAVAVPLERATISVRYAGDKRRGLSGASASRVVAAP